VREVFRQVSIRKPDASRDESRENFLVARGVNVG
jgi:23S rRNA U2552 (ribose-2'-O)-methylase RlmE/FtsJ